MGGASPFVIPFLSLTFLLSFMTINTIRTKTITTSSKPKPVVFKLVHSKSIVSTNYDLLYQTDDYYNDGPLVDLIPTTDASVLLLSFSIGQPPIPQLAIIDTGSSRIWVICSTNYQVQNTDPKYIFDPSQSTSFKKIPCQDALCPNSYCKTPESGCPFANSYAGGKGSSTNPRVTGVLASENFTFSTWDDGIIQAQVLFGCADPSTSSGGQITDDPRFNGIFGLGDTSFLSNIGGGKPKFSYCIGDITNSSYPYNQLQIGTGVELEGAPTPLKVGEEGTFGVVVDSISLGEELLNIDPHSFIIDTGAQFTYFAQKWYPIIADKINDTLKSLGFKDDETNINCYVGSVVDDLKAFPGLRLHLTDEVEMVLHPINLFYQRQSKFKRFCYAFKYNSLLTTYTSVLGLRAQQGYNMAFDVAEKKLYVQNVDCENYQD